MTNINFHFIVPIWGTEYTKRFVDIILPLYFAMENIKKDDRHKNNQFVIVTTYSDANVIRSSQSFEKLQSILPVSFILIDGLVDFSNCYIAMSQCHEIAMKQQNVIPGKTYFMFLAPDCFYSANTFDKCFELAEKNYSVAMVFGIRTTADSMTPLIEKKLKTSTETPLIPTTDLIVMAINNIHPLGKCCNWFSTTGFNNHWPSNVYWIDENKPQMVAHCFHMHPLMIKSPRKKVAVGDTIDGDFLKNLKYPLERHYVFTQNHFSVDLTDPKRECTTLAPYSQLQAVIKFGLYSAKYAHWHYFKHRITLNGCPNIPISNELISSAERVANSVLSYSRIKRLIFNDLGIKIIYKLQRLKNSNSLLLRIARKIKNTLSLT